MVLHREERQLSMSNSFDRAVIEVQVSDLELGSPWDPLPVSNYREAMILSGDEDLIGPQVSNRMVPATMTVGKLGGRTAIG
jgi:hypothetical protein